MSPKSILVTGSKGFIGRNIIKQLKSLKQEKLFIDQEIFHSLKWQEILKRKLDNFQPKIILHVGACSNTLEESVNFMMERNYLFTKIIMDWSYMNESRLVFSSSAANYGSNRVNPNNLYGWSKLVAEDYVISKGGVALRYFNVYGPGEEDKGKMASMAYQVMLNKSKKRVTNLFPGNPQRDFVHIDDIVHANIHAVNFFDDLKGKYYEVGSGESHKFEEILEILGAKYKYLDKKDIPKGYQFNTVSNKDLWMPKWRPKFEFYAGMKSYEAYFQRSFLKLVK